MSIVSLRGIQKAFGGRTALEPLSLEIDPGEIIGLLGHNGAGKSTTFGIMLGHVHPDAGQVFIHGHSVQNERSRALAKTGAIFETPCFYEYLTGEQNLDCLLALGEPCPRKRKDEVISLVGLSDRMKHRVGTYSHGMRQRLALAQALLPNPDFLLLDEPNDGLDPQGIIETRNLLRHLRDSEGKTIMFSSHILSEVEQLCDRVAILHSGQLVFWGKWREARGEGTTLRITCTAPDRAIEVFHSANVLFDPAVILAGVPFAIVVPENVLLDELCASLCAAGAGIREFSPRQPSLEDFYFSHLNGNTTRPADKTKAATPQSGQNPQHLP